MHTMSFAVAPRASSERAPHRTLSILAFEIVRVALIALVLTIALTATFTAPLKLQCLDQRDDGTSLCHLMRAVR